MRGIGRQGETDRLKLLLFDIDGTLVHSGGAGKRAMERSFEKVYGLPNGLEAISLMGRTDPSILKQALERRNLAWKENGVERFREYYFFFLDEELEVPNPNKRLCNGIRPLLEALDERSDLELGLLTGNWRYGAFLKLRSFGVEEYFPFGAYADDSEDRNKLVPVAMERFKQKHGAEISAADVYVIGDTPFDIRCAKPYGCRTVAVATGIHTLEQLAEDKPDYLFQDFSVIDDVVKIF
jgi:phosphoglycolate phosphatase-like HAD superfamily hydrolase